MVEMAAQRKADLVLQRVRPAGIYKSERCVFWQSPDMVDRNPLPRRGVHYSVQEGGSPDGARIRRVPVPVRPLDIYIARDVHLPLFFVGAVYDFRDNLYRQGTRRIQNHNLSDLICIFGGCRGVIRGLLPGIVGIAGLRQLLRRA